tara:strand:+ start:832 stop:1017 length:186 start_codon:yes stop_codon:yes gene_type:complete
MELSGARHVGMGGPSGLSAADISAALDFAGIEDRDHRGEVYRMVRSMDDALLNWNRKKTNG